MSVPGRSLSYVGLLKQNKAHIYSDTPVEREKQTRRDYVKSVKYLDIAKLQLTCGEYSMLCWLVLSTGHMSKHCECGTVRPNHYGKT